MRLAARFNSYSDLTGEVQNAIFNTSTGRARPERTVFKRRIIRIHHPSGQPIYVNSIASQLFNQVLEYSIDQIIAFCNVLEIEMSLIEHAKTEFEALGWPGDDEMQEMICDNLIELLEVFSEQGHSGSSAPYLLNLFDKLARFNPISPLTGEDSEWREVSDGMFQNKRDSSVFKNSKDGEAYWIEGKIFREPSGVCFTNSESRVPVVFPWVKPEPEIIDRPKTED